MNNRLQSRDMLDLGRSVEKLALHSKVLVE